MTLTREEWQESPSMPIDSVMEAEMDLHDRNKLIRLLGQVVYRQQKLIRNAFEEDGSPRVMTYGDPAGREWSFSFVQADYRKLMDELLPQLPSDWTETLEV